MSDVIVVGGGMIGAAVAWRAAAAGLRVTVVDPAPERGAWRTAAGMLAPATEFGTTETPLLRLSQAALARFPGFVAELEAETGTSVGLRDTGTLEVAWDAADLTSLTDRHHAAARHGVETELVTGSELRALEPSLAAGLPGGLLAPGDHSIDPRLLHAALLTAARTCGTEVIADTASLVCSDGAVRGARLESSGTVLAAPRVVLAAGAWSGLLDGLFSPAGLPVRPVKGQTLRLSLPGVARLGRTLRGTVRGSTVYVVPRADGRLVVGASVEEAGFDMTPRAGAVYELLRDAQALLPELGEATLDEVCTGLRPGSPDNAPIVGSVDGIDGLVVATGHHRNGVLLAPITADAVTALLAGSAPDDVFAPFTPSRFAGAHL